MSESGNAYPDLIARANISNEFLGVISWTRTPYYDSPNNETTDLDQPTTIDNTGLLSLRPFENESIKIVVSSSKYNLQESFDIKVKPLSVGSDFSFFGKTYKYLKNLGEGNRLVYGIGDQVQTTYSDVQTFVSYNESNLNKALKLYYSQLSEKAQSVVQPVQLTFNVGVGNESDLGLDENNFLFSNPPNDFAEVTQGGEKKAFALSVAEISDVSGPGKAFPELMSRSDNGIDFKGVSTWTRTPYDHSGAQSVIWIINKKNGEFGLQNQPSRQPLPPALIINQ